MSKKTLFLVSLVSISMITVGCVNKQEKENTPTKEIPAQVEKTIPSIITLKVGDKIGNFTVSKIEPLNKEKELGANNFSIVFNGQATVTGDYEFNEMQGSHFLTPDNMDNLPVLKEKASYALSFPSNDSVFKNPTGKAKITFDGLILQSSGEEFSTDGSNKITSSEILK